MLKMIHKINIVALATLSFFLFGCATMNLDMTGIPQQVQLTPLSKADQEIYEIQSEFQDKKWHHYFFYGWFTGRQPNFYKLLSEQLPSKDSRIVEFTMNFEGNLLQSGICFLTLSLYCPKIIKFKGKTVAPFSMTPQKTMQKNKKVRDCSAMHSMIAQ